MEQRLPAPVTRPNTATMTRKLAKKLIYQHKMVIWDLKNTQVEKINFTTEQCNLIDEREGDERRDCNACTFQQLLPEFLQSSSC